MSPPVTSPHRVSNSNRKTDASTRRNGLIRRRGLAGAGPRCLAARDFLDTGVVPYQTSDAKTELKTADIARNARAFTLLITCKAAERTESTKDQGCCVMYKRGCSL